MKNPIKVALVDDHHLLRNGLARIIDRFDGYSVVLEAGNGREFIDILAEDENLSPDIILLDISMPEMDGYQTAEWIKENLPEARVLILSMLDNEIAVLRMLQLGARGYVLKDIKPTVLKEAFDHIQNYGYYSNDLVTSRLLTQVANSEPGTQPAFTVSQREKEFLHMVCSDLTYREIAGKMNVSSRTVDNYRDSLFHKFGFKTRVGLALFAIKSGYYEI